MIKLAAEQLEIYARDLFRKSLASFADAEESVVSQFVQKVAEKHTIPNSLRGAKAGMPAQQHQWDLFDFIGQQEQMQESESRL